jgi:hypothetical protein
MSSWNKGSSSSVDRILKMDLDGNKSLWVSNGNTLSGYSYLGDEESFYTLEPIYYYTYTDSNSITHYILKRIDNDKELELPTYIQSTQSRRYIYDNNFYFCSSNKDSETKKYPVYKVDLTEMTCEVYGWVSSYSANFILYNHKLCVVANYKIYSIDDLNTPIATYYSSSKMYNDVRIDGIEEVDGGIQGTHSKATLSSSGLVYAKTKQNLYQISEVKSFPVVNDLCLTWYGSSANKLKSTQIYKYRAILLKEGTTSSDIDLTDATATSEEIAGGKVAFIRDGKTIGTMTNNGELHYTPNNEEQTIPAGYTLGGTIDSIEDSADYNDCINLANDILSI